jgi:Zn-dependent protease
LTAYLVLLFSLSVHESAHAWTALQEGDPTAQSLGRISLNPLVHSDLIGTVVLPLLMIFTGVTWLFGWAKPTPVNPRYFKDLKRGQIIVSGAGPTSNLMLAVLFTAALFLALRVVPEPSSDNPLFRLLVMGIQLNVVLAIFNLVPLPPLDGSHILQWALPNGLGHRFVRMIGPYGGFILLALVMTGALWTLIGPVVDVIVESLIALARFQ